MRIWRSSSPILLAAGAVLAAGYESSVVFKASDLLPPELRKGQHFEVKEDVSTPGYFHEFQIASEFGALEAGSKSLLMTRLREIDALARLEDVSKTEVFVKAAGNSVLNVGKGVASVVTDPGGTVKGMGSGIKRFGNNLGRKSKRAAESATSGDESSQKSAGEKTTDAGLDVAQSALGVTGSMRRWAQKLQVDPYTSNPVLRKALEDIGKIDAAGGIAAKVVVPIPMVVSATASVGGLVWGKDPEALLKLNEQRVAELGTEKKAAAAFFKSKAFRLGNQTRFIAALYAVKVKGCGDYVDTAEEAQNELQVLFYTESAEMLSRFHASNPVEALLPDSKAVVARTKDGRGVVLLALDYVAWTPAAEKALGEISARAKAELKVKSLELRTSGRVSERAKQELKAQGWSTVENVAPQPSS